MAERILEASDISVFVTKQTLKGAIDASPVFIPFRRLEGKVKDTVNYTQSAEVTTDRQAKKNIRDGSSFEAEISFEKTEQSIPFLQDAMQGTEVTVTVTDVDIAATATGFTDAAGDGFTGMALGDYVFVSGFVDPAAAGINRAYRITTFATGAIDTDPPPPAIEAIGPTVTVQMRKTVSASTIPYFTGQTRIVDTSKAGGIDYQTRFDGIIDASSFEIPETGIVTGSQTILFQETVDGTAIISGQTDAADDTSDPLSAKTNITRFWINGSETRCVIKSMGFDYSNNSIPDEAAACPGAEYANGTVTLSGSLNSRLRIDDSMVWRDRYKNGTLVALAIEIEHSPTKHTIIEVPQAVITDHNIPNSDGSVANSEMTYTAEKDSRGTTAVIYRDWA